MIKVTSPQYAHVIGLKTVFGEAGKVGIILFPPPRGWEGHSITMNFCSMFIIVIQAKPGGGDWNVFSRVGHSLAINSVVVSPQI